MSGLDFEIGSTISHFRLEKKLGEGGMGSVYLAEDLTLSRKIAIKFMSRNLVAKQAKTEVREALEVRFIREAKSAAAINHPNVCQIYEANFDSDDWYIAMEFIPGKDLVEQSEEKGKFSPSEVADTCRQVASGLKYAWNHYKIVHRDIKPRNIMITEEGMVKIVDLGLAKPVTQTGEDTALPDVTMAGTAIGTPQYMAPEQATGDTNIDYMVDIYALGATLYEMCTGVKAFNERTPTMIYMAQMGKKYKPIREFRTDIPDALIQLIDDMLEPNREDRIDGYDEILDRIRNMSQSSRNVFDDDDMGQETMEVTQIAESIFRDYPEDHMILNRYRVMKKVGQSRAGVVYKCIDSETGAECAVKSLAPEREFSAKDLPGVRENYKRLIGKDDTNLVKVMDVMEVDHTGETFVVMERLEGINLREYVHLLYTESSTLNMRSLVTTLRKVARAIDRLNESLGFPHNDIKPESVFIPTDGNDVKLLDYGITQRSVAATTTTIGGTDYKEPLESTDYMAPEKWEHGAVSHHADQYAFALVVYETLARRLPFWINDPGLAPDTTTRSKTKLERARYEKMKKQVLEDAVPTIATIDKNLNVVLMTALSKHPEERFPNCQAFVARLAKAAGIKEKSPLAPLLAGVAILAVVVAGVFFYLRMQDLNECKTAESSYEALMTQVPVGTLSKGRLTDCVQRAEGFKAEAEGLKKAGKLKLAIIKYEQANAEMQESLKNARDMQDDYRRQADDLDLALKNDIKGIREKVLATALVGEDLLPLESEIAATSKITENDLRLDALLSTKEKLDGLAMRYKEELGNLGKTADERRSDASLAKKTVESVDLCDTTPKGKAILASLQRTFNEAAAKHDEPDKKAVIRRWSQVIDDAKHAHVELDALREEYREYSASSQATYDKLKKDLKKNYGKMADAPLKALQPMEAQAVGLHEKGDFVNASEKWKEAIKTVTSEAEVVKNSAVALAAEIDGIRKGILEAKVPVIKSPFGGKELLVPTEKQIQAAVALEKVGDLPKARDGWVKARELLAEAEKALKLRILSEEKNRKARGKEIATLRAGYRDRYLAIKSHSLAPGLLQTVPDPSKILADVPLGADDQKSLDLIQKADNSLKSAEELLRKRIVQEEETMRKKAFAQLSAFDKDIDLLSKNPFAQDLIRPARRHREAAEMAYNKKSYDTAIISMTSANNALKKAKLELQEIMKSEQRRRDIMVQRTKVELQAQKKAYAEGFEKLGKEELAQDLVNPVALKGDQANAIEKAGGTPSDALKAWEKAVGALKDAEAELSVRLKNRQDKEAALERKLRRECELAEKTFVEGRAELADNPFAVSKLGEADVTVKDAKAAMTKGDVKGSLVLWKRAHAQLEAVHADLQVDIKTQALKLKDEVEALRKTAKEWETWDPAVREKLVGYDVSMARAREKLERNAYMDAGKELLACKAILTKLQEFVMAKFVGKPGSDFVLGKVGMEFVWVKNMKMWVGKFEVTNRQYRVMKPTHSSRKHQNMSLDGADQPACWLTYYDAVAYCTYLTASAQELGVLPKGYQFRLPTRKEWVRFATSGNPDRKFPWGDEWPPKSGNFANREMFPDGWRLDSYKDDFPVTCPVTKSGANEWGIYGVSGNVWEWNSDKKGPDFAVFGGSWNSRNPDLMKLDLGGKNYANPQKSFDNIGFRVLLAPKDN